MSVPQYVLPSPTPPSDWKLYKRLLGYLKPYQGRFVASMLSSIPSGVLSGGSAFLVGSFVDKLLKEQNYQILYLLPIAILGINLVEGICGYINTYQLSYTAAAISRDLRYQLFQALSKMDLKYINTNSPGDLMSRYYNDPSRLQESIVTNLSTIIQQGVMAIALLFVLLYRSWQFSIVSVGILSLIVFPLRIISQKLRKLDQENQLVAAQMYDVFNETVFGYRMIKVFGLHGFQVKRFQVCLQDFFGNAMSLTRAGAILRPIMQVITAIGISLILIFGTFQLQQGHMSPGDLVSFLAALVMLYKPVKDLAGTISKVQRIFAPAARVFEKLDLTSSITEIENPTELTEFKSLAFENVSFSYVDDTKVLHNINLSVNAGETIALVGESGGGKSTLADLIPRFIDPQEGRVLMNGVDIRHVSLDSLRHQISVVSQETLLFDATIWENVKMGNLKATDEAIWKAMDIAHLTATVKAMPDGEHTRIGSRGILLSGGQKQRLAIARAFLKDSPVLILDEATSALDNESEKAVQDGLKTIMQGKTVFVIAHRLSTIRYANRILVINKGRIQESGNHNELMALNGTYAKLYNLQFREEELPNTIETSISEPQLV